MVSMSSILKTIMAISIGLLVLAIIFPIATYQLLNATWHPSMNSGVLLLITVLVPIMAIIAIVVLFIPNLGGKNSYFQKHANKIQNLSQKYTYC